MQVIVMGGTGHVGGLVLDELRRVGMDSRSATRPGFDLTRPETLEALPDDALLIDAASGPNQPPDEFIRWALERGRRLMVTSADFGLYQRLHEGKLGDGPGSVCLGVGVYPGLSNLLAAEASRRVGGANSIELHLEWSVLSAAGASTVDLMIEALRGKAVTWRGGALQEEEPFARRATSFDAWPMAFPETLMIPRSLGAKEVTTVATLRPRLPGTLMRVGTLAMRGDGMGSRLTRAMATLVLRALRGGVLRAVGTSARVSVLARRESRVSSLTLNIESAFNAAAAFIGLASEELARRADPPRGVVMPDELLSLEETLEALQKRHPGLVVLQS